MIELSQLYVVLVLLAVGLGLVAVWSPRGLAVKLVATGLAVGFVPLGWVALSDLLSRPKPVSLEWWAQQAEEATVLGSRLQEGRGIYLWLQLAELAEPRAYVLPWDRSLAEQLQQALREAEENGSQVRMRLPFELSWDDREPKFYALPQPALPPKDLTPHAPEIYRRPESQA